MVEAVCRGEAEFALVDEPPGLWLLYRFSHKVSWGRANFNIHLVPERQRADPVLFTAPDQGFQGLVTVLDADTALVRGLRLIGLTPEFSLKLAELIQAQALAPWRGKEEDDRQVREVARRFPAPGPMLARVVCRMTSVSNERSPPNG